MENLTDRQKTILSRLIDVHIESAQPVGSKLLTGRYGIETSPATVRHELGHLEDLGYLMHTHSSSGRLPTDSGYRYYVDHCVTGEAPEIMYHRRLDQLLSEDQEGDIERYAENASRLLSDLSEEVGLMLIPGGETAGTDDAWKLLVRGITHMIDKPEFRDRQKIRVLFEVLEEKKKLIRWISDSRDGKDITVLIGRENEPEALWECSIVCARYHVPGMETGCIAIMGPRRMRYRHALPLVKKTAQIVESVLKWTEE